MCTVITHPAVPLALSVLLPAEVRSVPILVAGSLCSIAPDVDVVSFDFGIKYGDVLGHRGFTHSIVFAIILAVLVSLIWFRHQQRYLPLIFLFLLLSTLSHPLLDACTNGGLGVAFFAPFNNQRYFFPYRPIAVSPLGLHFFSQRGLEVLWSECKWVWVPSALFFVAGIALKRMRLLI